MAKKLKHKINQTNKTVKKTDNPKILANIKVKKEKILSLYGKNLCNISTTCKAVGIGRCAFYDYRKEDAEFDKRCSEIEESMIDMAESALSKAVNAGNVTAMIFFLCNLGRRRGWQHVQKIDHAHGGKLEATIEYVVGGKE